MQGQALAPALAPRRAGIPKRGYAMMPWQTVIPGLASPFDAPSGPGSWPDHIVFVVLFCALVDFIKLLIELMGREEDRRFTSDMSLVSVIIACKNGEKVLPGTIADLLRYLPPGRIIVVDDGSTDKTSEVVAALGCQVHRFEHSKGKAAAINFAIHRVKTSRAVIGSVIGHSH